MTGVADIVAGTLDLLGLCRDGFALMREVFAADRALDLALGRLELQKECFEEWRAIWRDESGKRDARFSQFAKEHPATARRILKQLALLSQVLCDVKSLERRFGFIKTERLKHDAEDLSFFRFEWGEDLTLDMIKKFRVRCNINLSFIQKSRFSIHKRDTHYTELIEVLKEYNQNLRSLVPSLDVERVMRSEFDIMKRMVSSELRRLADAAAYEAKHSLESVDITRYQELALAASFTNVLKYDAAKPVYQFSLKDFHIDPSYQITRSATMALLFDYPIKHERRVVLIEWFKAGGRSDRREEAEEMALVLATSKPDGMLLPNSYGVLEDRSHGRVGLVLAPPAHIRGGLPRTLPPGSISGLRMPISLRDIITKKHTNHGALLDLGVRFQMAKKMLDAVHLMHATSWVHRNIRPDAIIFFAAPERTKSGVLGPSTEKPQFIALDEPMFVGYNYARSGTTVTINDDSYYYTTAISRGYNLDFYQHPDKVRDPRIVSESHHDLFSLGCVLLEIAYWQTLDVLLGSHLRGDPLAVVRRIQSLANPGELDGMMGKIYADVVRKLLSLGSVHHCDYASALEVELAASLSQCVA